MRRLLFLVGFALMFFPGPLAAQAVDGDDCPPSAPHCEEDEPTPSFDARFGLLQDLAERGDFDSPVFGPEGAPPHLTEEAVGASLRFSDELTEEEIARLEELGVRFQRRDDEVVHVGAIYSASVEWDAFDRLAERPDLERVEAEWYPTLDTPLEETSEMVGAAQARKLPQASVDGEGVTVADIDQGFDVLHPHFFRADGGYYEWHDENENGTFDPGVDTVEVDGEEAELEVLDATRVDRTYRDTENDDGQLQADLDWVYLDVDDDDERDVGPADGFEESDPAYGEPIFVVDDVDKNGKLDPGEKLVRLDTPKFEKIVANGDEYVRGENLIEAVDAQEQISHGTSVMSTVGGGQPGYHRRVGLAPGVDMIGYTSTGEQVGQGDERRFDTPIAALDDAADEGAGLVLHEWTDIVSQAPDGSSNVEQAIDAAHEEGLVQVNPVGNLNVSEKHLRREITGGESVEESFHVGDGFQYGQQTLPYSAVYLLVMWHDNEEPTLTLENPEGETHQVVFSTQTDSFGDAQVYAQSDRTERGTSLASIVIWNENREESLPQGDWGVRLDELDRDDVVTARVSDLYSSWNPGVVWNEPTRDHSTIVFPSSADSAFGVGAFAGRNARHDSIEDSDPGELRDYSGRGPRIDGQPVLDIAAPDDPYAALGASEEVLEAGVGRSWFQTFGGTSGAAPHVAAAVALLRDEHPEMTPEEIEERLVETARDDDLEPEGSGLPNRFWGHGKVDAFGALYDEPRPGDDNDMPQAVLEVETGEEYIFDASDSTDADGDSLEYRFDIDYDGEWETDWAEESTLMVDEEDFNLDQKYTARVQVRDAEGAESGALADYSGPKPALAEDDDSDEGCGCDAGKGPRPGGVLLVLVFVGWVVGRRGVSSVVG